MDTVAISIKTALISNDRRAFQRIFPYLATLHPDTNHTMTISELDDLAADVLNSLILEDLENGKLAPFQALLSSTIPHSYFSDMTLLLETMLEHLTSERWGRKVLDKIRGPFSVRTLNALRTINGRNIAASSLAKLLLRDKYE